MLIPDLMVLARRKLGPGARYFFSVDRSGDRAHATAEVFCSARPGANVPDERKTARIASLISARVAIPVDKMIGFPVEAIFSIKGISTSSNEATL